MDFPFRGTETIMNSHSIAERVWTSACTEDGFDQMQEVEDILKRLADSFTEVNIAADFLHLRSDPESQRPELQLTCLIKDRIAAIQEHVTALYCALNRPYSPSPALKQ